MLMATGRNLPIFRENYQQEFIMSYHIISYHIISYQFGGRESWYNISNKETAWCFFLRCLISKPQSWTLTWALAIAHNLAAPRFCDAPSAKLWTSCCTRAAAKLKGSTRRKNGEGISSDFCLFGFLPGVVFFVHFAFWFSISLLLNGNLHRQTDG